MAEPRLLFLLSGDYGELSSAVYFLRGTGLDATLLLPGRLFEVNRDTLPARSGRYDSLADVIGFLDSARPDLMLLFSGYLYAINGILELPAVEALLDELKARRIRVVTSDPFLGLLRARGASPFSDRHPQRQWLTDHFARLATGLQDVTHLYLVPPDGVSGERKVSVFNPDIVSESGMQQRTERLARRIALDPQRPRWLFLLASEDYGAQIARLGRDRFEALLLERLEDTARAGCQPLLMGPRPCVEVLSTAGRGIPGLILMSFCAHDLFEDLLLEARYVFYWNVLSNSLLARMANRLPVLFFDRGHLANAMPALLELGLETYFDGAQLPLLDQRKALTPGVLAELAVAQDSTLRGALENFRRSPLPRALVRQLLAEGPDAAG
jgi:hypothetical protein